VDLGLVAFFGIRAVADHVLEGRTAVGRTLCAASDVIGFGEAAGGDEAFRPLVLARIIEPTSKADSLRVIDETGVARCHIRPSTSPSGIR
jgi:hypothetical protein